MLKLNKLYNMDCMEGMKDFPDKYFDLAIVDPPYGIGVDKMQLGTGKNRLFTQNKKWDSNIPDESYFLELFRISKNQIIWGANHFVNYLAPSRGWIFWDKMTDGFSESYASGELAFTSFDRTLKQFTFKQQGNYIGYPNQITTTSSNKTLSKIHPTQKPVALYEWLLKNYSNQGDKILDTHVGSGSSVIACLEYELEWIGFEIDKEYYDDAIKRIEQFKQRPKPMISINEIQTKQNKIDI